MDIAELTKRIETLEKKFERANFEELVRDVVFFDIDTRTTTTTTATANLITGIVTVPKTPAKYIRAYFRGQPYNIAVYTIT